MRIHQVNDYREMSQKAASIVSSQVILKKTSVLGLATGSTPEGMYHRLIEMYHEGIADFSQITTFNLDEYLGLSPQHPQSYHYYMNQHFFEHIDIPATNINIPPGKIENSENVCREYDKRIAASGGIDLQVLGIGVNGHIGFNEPDQYLNVGTHVVNLTEETIETNSRFFTSREEVPRQAITMGMGSIMQARRVLLLASGKSKAQAIRDTVNGKVTTRVPASFLQLHPQFILVLDKEAASLL